MGTLRQLRWVNCCRFIHGEDADGMQALGTLNGFADDAGTLVGSLETRASKASNNVGECQISLDPERQIRSPSMDRST